MKFSQGMRRLAIFAGIIGALAGGFHSYRVLRYVPSERYQNKVFEKLAASGTVEQARAPLLVAKANGAINGGPLVSEPIDPQTPPATLPPDFKGWDRQQLSMQSALTNKIKAIVWKPDLSVDYFEMQDGGYVFSEPSPSVWLYLLWVAFPALGFVVLWSAIRGIGWVVAGFLPNLN